MSNVVNRRAAASTVGLASLAVLVLALGGCGDGVAAGGENAAEHPSTGIYVSPTVGAGNTSGHPIPPATVQVPSSTPPSPTPAGLVATASAVQSALASGCWENAHAGDIYGAWDQLFWWQGQCATSTGDQVTVELFPTVAAASAAAHHATADALQARYLSGAVLVNVFATASPAVLSNLSAVKSLRPVPGYGA